MIPHLQVASAERVSVPVWTLQSGRQLLQLPQCVDLPPERFVFVAEAGVHVILPVRTE